MKIVNTVPVSIADMGNGIIVDSEGIEGDVLSVPAVILPAPPLPSVLVPSNVSPLVPRRPYTCSCGAFYFCFFLLNLLNLNVIFINVVVCIFILFYYRQYEHPPSVLLPWLVVSVL